MKSGWNDTDQLDLQNPARGIRLQRVLADLGVGARRTCERIIEEGRVEINGKVVQKLPIFVDPGHDHIAVDGRPLPKTSKPTRRLYVMLHKPERTLTVSTDEPGADRRTVLDLVQHPGASRLYPVGRLEFESTGLVLLTNDGELANRLSHPRFGVAKVYHAIVKGDVTDQVLAELEKDIFEAERRAARTQTRMQAAGVTFKGEVPMQLRTSKPIKGIYRPAHVQLKTLKKVPGKTVVEITLTEGRNRHVEGMFAARGLSIRKMTQVGLGPLELSGLAVGAWRELEREEIIALLRAVKDTKGARAGKPGPRKTFSSAAGGAKPQGGSAKSYKPGGSKFTGMGPDGGRSRKGGGPSSRAQGPRPGRGRPTQNQDEPNKTGAGGQDRSGSERPSLPAPKSGAPKSSGLASNRRPRVIGGKKP